MWQYYVFFILLFLFFIVTQESYKPLSRAKTVFAAITFFMLWLLIGLRDKTVGIDTIGYVGSFNNATTLLFETQKKASEPLYQIFEYVVRYFTSNYHIFLLVSSVSMCYALFKVFDRFLKTPYEVMAGFCIYVLMGIMSFNMAGIRQTIAMSLGFLAFIAIDEGKWKKTIIFIIAAYLFHNTAIVLLLILPAYYFNLRKYALYASIIIALLGVVAPSYISTFIGSYLITQERFDGYTLEGEGQTYVAFALQFILVIVAYIRRREIPLPEKTVNFLFTMAYLGLAIQSTSWALYEMARLSFYFSMFDIVLVPLALTAWKSNNMGNFIRPAFIFGCLFYIFVLAHGDNVLPALH